MSEVFSSCKCSLNILYGIKLDIHTVVTCFHKIANIILVAYFMVIIKLEIDPLFDSLIFLLCYLPIIWHTNKAELSTERSLKLQQSVSWFFFFFFRVIWFIAFLLENRVNSGRSCIICYNIKALCCTRVLCQNHVLRASLIKFIWGFVRAEMIKWTVISFMWGFATFICFYIIAN